MFFGPPHTPSPQPPRKFCDDDDDPNNQTTPKKHKRSRTSFSGNKRGNTKASRKAAKAAAEPKTPRRRAQTRRRSGHGQTRPPNRQSRPLLLSPWPFSLQQMSFEGLVRICGGEQPPIPAAKMTFVLVLGRSGKTSSLLLSSRPTCCVPSPSVEESVSYSTTRKNGRTCSNISRRAL